MSLMQCLLKQTSTGQQIIHSDHGIGGMLLTESITHQTGSDSQASSSSIMSKITAVDLQSEEGVPWD